jgi:hypothetical protein
MELQVPYLTESPKISDGEKEQQREYSLWSTGKQRQRP